MRPARERRNPGGVIRVMIFVHFQRYLHSPIEYVVIWGKKHISVFQD